MRLLALMILVAVLAIAHSAHAWDTAEAGYLGGTPFRETCDGGVLVGLDLRQGVWMDGVRPICARIDDHGQFGAPEAGTYFGGLGGAPKTAMCRAGSAVRGVKITLFRQDKYLSEQGGIRPGGGDSVFGGGLVDLARGEFVGNLHLICADVRSGQLSEVGTGWTVSPEDTGKAAQVEGPQYGCGRDGLAAGIFGATGQGRIGTSNDQASGVYLVRFGLSCAKTGEVFEPGRRTRCEAYAQRAMARQAMRQYCRLDHPHFSVPYQGHVDWCLGVPRAEANAQDAARDKDVDACKRGYCEQYAARSSMRRTWASRCGLTHAHYGVTQSGHFNWCMGTPMPEVVAQDSERAAEVSACQSRFGRSN